MSFCSSQPVYIEAVGPFKAHELMLLISDG